MPNWVAAVIINSLWVGFLASPALCHQSLIIQKLPEQFPKLYGIYQQPVIPTDELFSNSQEETDPTDSSPTRGAGRRS